ncbi:MAG: hypothetical protein BGO68_01655 [Candidatus Amoebophilus sp. 36-38]|nr:MAG: hypothetical protein BGO68_01655 [Candidatus Amoebophilus sp. 36-38]
MKNRVLFLLIFFLTISYVNAAEKPVKIGYVNLSYLMSLLPDTRQFETDYKAFENQLKNQLQIKAAELQDKLQSFQQGYATMTDAVKNQKESELQQLHGEFEKLQIESQSSLANKQLQLLQPIYNKIQKAVQEVAKENKYTHVLNADADGMSVVLYAEEEYNISNLVLKKLGIDSAKAAKEAIEKSMKKTQETKTQDTGKKVQEAKATNKKKN